MSALVVFSPNVPRLATFYERVIGAQPTKESSGDIRLRSEVDEVLIHSMSKKAAARVQISDPPVARSDASLKPVFDVPSLQGALEQVTPAGGVVMKFTFTQDGLTRHDVIDPDGNVIQLRSRS
jgi:predicted enzyme related to lactoylglutathione lyase